VIKIDIFRAKIMNAGDKSQNKMDIFGKSTAYSNDKYKTWGSYFGMFRDKYGIEWMVDFDPKYKGQTN
jgi:PhnB protein